MNEWLSESLGGSDWDNFWWNALSSERGSRVEGVKNFSFLL